MRLLGNVRFAARKRTCRPWSWIGQGGRPDLTRIFALGALWVVLFLVASGCTRSFYRQASDREVAQLLEEKDQDPAWKLQNFFTYPHPLSRFADPTHPDRPPMPPDDPAAWFLAPRPQKPKEVASVE